MCTPGLRPPDTAAMARAALVLAAWCGLCLPGAHALQAAGDVPGDAPEAPEASEGVGGTAPGAVRLVESRWPAAAAGPVGPVATAQVWRQSVLWQQHARTRLGVGLAVRTPVPAGGPLAGQRGADTTAVSPTAPEGQRTAPAAVMALVLVGHPVAHGLSVDAGMGLPLAGTPARMPHDGVADTVNTDLRGEVRMGLSFQARSATGDLRRGLTVRVDLSGATALTLRPRGGGRLLLQLSSQW